MKKLEMNLGSFIKESIKSTINLAQENNLIYCFDFNGVKIIISNKSNFDIIYRDWSRAMDGYLGENPEVGPEPNTLLSPEDLENDRAIEKRRPKSF